MKVKIKYKVEPRIKDLIDPIVWWGDKDPRSFKWKSRESLKYIHFIILI